MQSTGEPAWHMPRRQLGLVCHSRYKERPDDTGVLETACNARVLLRETAHAHGWAQGLL